MMIILVVLFCISVLMIISMIMTGNPSKAVKSSTIPILSLISMFFLYRGRYKLAESSSVSAGKIEEIVARLISSVRSAGEEVEKSGSSFRHVRTETSLVREAMNEINQSVAEIAGGSDEVLKATASMNDLTAQVAGSVRETSDYGLQGRDNLEQLELFIDGLKQEISGIRDDSHSIHSVSSELQNICNSINLFVKDSSGSKESA